MTTMRVGDAIRLGVVMCWTACSAGAAQEGTTPTPPSPLEPRIHGPTVFGARPNAPFLYTIPATGERPVSFGAEGLPAGLGVDAASGRITGAVAAKGEYAVTLTAKNAKGHAEKKFRIVIGDRIALTPPMGWNSWNCWAHAVDQEKVLRSARAVVASGLINHGWSYVNIDDTWQGARGGIFGAIQGNEKFPDMKKLCDEIHAMGLKAGIYSSPWITTYAKYAGSTSDHPDGAWSKDMATDKFWRIGKYSFAEQDARQWADWGIDYLKYDWMPNDVPSVRTMSQALRTTGRDIVFSLSNRAPFADAAAFAQLAECWRTTGDIYDSWGRDNQNREWMDCVSEIGFSQDAWAPYAGPGHWNDPDMLVVGLVGWSANLHQTHLTPDEQYAHISLWCLLSAPLLIGCDLERLDAFTLGLLTNDDVLAIDQDALGRQAVRVGTMGPIDVFKKDLEDGGMALGFFNRGDSVQTTAYDKLRRLGFKGKVHVRDLWRQTDLPDANGHIPVTVPPHGVLLVKVTTAK